MHSHEHVVQPYGTDERLLARNVSRYLARAREILDRARHYQNFRPHPV